MNLQTIKNTLPDIMNYRGKEFRMTFYDSKIYRTKKFPTRSQEIIWEDSEGNRIYLNKNFIEYLPFK